MKITRQKWDGLNFEKIRERAEELETFPSYLPSVFTSYINIENRLKYLEKNNLLDKVQKETKKHRDEFKKSKEKSETRIKEVLDWINENPEYIELINIKE